MDSFLISAAVVAVAEIGDKTQILALLLAARYRAPLPIILGILLATLANHALAALLGASLADWLGPEALRWILGVSFLAMAAWMLVPDSLEGEPRLTGRLGPFLATLFAFFLVEIGDKTQVATVALSAKFDAPLVVTLGTTLGMLLANVPAVLLAGFAAERLPLKTIHAVAAALFALLGLLALVGAGDGLAGVGRRRDRAPGQDRSGAPERLVDLRGDIGPRQADILQVAVAERRQLAALLRPLLPAHQHRQQAIEGPAGRLPCGRVRGANGKRLVHG